MSSPYIGEIRMFAGNFAPAGWAFCNGQLLAISEFDTLFNLIGTTYGGDGQVTFALPDLRGRLPIHQGGGFTLAQNGGAEEVTLTVNQVPSHSHPM
ncbi:MAG: phage tail protein, partial [Acidimicrobiia bacterium]|nr:phage tail protein [Acidimicrobiia bacterium]